MSTELPSPPLPPLTAEDFQDACGHKHRDIAIVESEDGDVFTFGHIALAEFAAAAREHEAELIGELDEEDQIHTLDVVHRWAVTIRTDDDPDGWLINWYPDITEETPGAFPMTVAIR